MRTAAAATLLLALEAEAWDFGPRKTRAKAQVWRPSAEGFTYPEDALPHLQGREEFGVALAGGGLRGMSLAHGTTRSLHKAGLLKRAKYYSVSSGSVWLGLPLYFQDQDSLDALFGENLSPAEKTPEKLTSDVAGSFITRLQWPVAQYPENMTHVNSSKSWGWRTPAAILDSAVAAHREIGFDRHLWALLTKLEGLGPTELAACADNPCQCVGHDVVPIERLHEVWTLVTSFFLWPFGLTRTGSSFCHASQIDTTQAKLGARADIYSSRDAEQELPFFISQSAVFSYKSGTDRTENPLRAFPIERTLMYSGVPVPVQGDELGPESYKGLGDLLVEPFAFSSTPLEPIPNASSSSIEVELEPRVVGDLSRLQAITTCAAAAWQIKPSIDDMSKKDTCTSDVLEMFFPHERLWSPLDVDSKHVPVPHWLPVGDAGVYDDIGHLPLLRRGVKKMVLFDSAGHLTDDNGQPLVTVENNVYLKAAFGAASGPKDVRNPPGSPNPLMLDNFLTVFEPSEFPSLWEKITSFHNRGEPAIVRDTFTVVDNPHFGIKGGWKVEIVWVVYLPSAAFRAELPELTNSQLPEYFPNIQSQEGWSQFELSAMSQYASWVTDKAIEQEVRAMLDGDSIVI